jgi:molybdopterin guanine dinucleotide-containing S/N-oxide reductase-like protein
MESHNRKGKQVKKEKLAALKSHAQSQNPVTVTHVTPVPEVKEKTVIKAVHLGGGPMEGEPCCVDVKNGRIVRIRPLHYDDKYTKEEVGLWKLEARGKTFKPRMKSLPPYFAFAYKKRVYSPSRIKYPLKRVDWDPNGERNPQNRGKSKFKRISWDEALEIISSEIKRVQQKYGPYSVLCMGEDGHHEDKCVHMAGGCHMRLMNEAGGYTREIRNADSWEGWYWGAKHVWGEGSVGLYAAKYEGGLREPLFRGHNEFKDISENTEMIVQQGSDWETTPAGFGSEFMSLVGYWFTELGIKQIFISPDLNYAAAVHADKWIPVLPNTDAALQLAITYIWITEGTYDKDYVATHVFGFDKFSDYVLGKEDGTPKTPEWASNICNVPEWTIKALAREWASKVTTMGHYFGGGMIRGLFSHEPARLECILLGMQGLGRPGVHQIHWGMGMPKTVVTPAVKTAMRARSFSPMPQQIPRTMVHHAILNPPITFYGSTAIMASVEDQFIKYTYPIPEEEGGTEIHLLWSEKVCNTACWNDGNMFIEAIRNPKIECYIANHQWLENDCLFADIVLPVTTKFEEDDIKSPNRNIWAPMLHLERQAIKPIGESMSDYLIAGEVAKKLGVHEKYTEGKTVEEWIKTGYEESGIKDMISWEEFNEKGFFIVPTDPKWKEEPAGLIGFYTDPVKNPLPTPSGKLEFYSQRLADNFPDDKERGPVPHWVPGGPGWTHDESLWSERAKKYPLLLMSNHPRWRHHSQGEDISWFREIPTCKVRGYDGYMYEPVWLNPATAVERGIESGDIVKVYNDRGIILGGAYVTERLMPGVAYMDHGARVDPITDKINRGGTTNLISPSKGISRNCWGMATSGYLVEVEKLDPTEMEEWRGKYPEAFNRNYDPASGMRFNAWVEEDI